VIGYPNSTNRQHYVPDFTTEKQIISNGSTIYYCETTIQLTPKSYFIYKKYTIQTTPVILYLDNIEGIYYTIEYYPVVGSSRDHYTYITNGVYNTLLCSAYFRDSYVWFNIETDINNIFVGRPFRLFDQQKIYPIKLWEYIINTCKYRAFSVNSDGVMSSVIVDKDSVFDKYEPFDSNFALYWPIITKQHSIESTQASPDNKTCHSAHTNFTLKYNEIGYMNTTYITACFIDSGKLLYHKQLYYKQTAGQPTITINGKIFYNIDIRTPVHELSVNNRSYQYSRLHKKYVKTGSNHVLQLDLVQEHLENTDPSQNECVFWNYTLFGINYELDLHKSIR
jgi:hypothetical protein